MKIWHLFIAGYTQLFTQPRQFFQDVPHKWSIPALLLWFLLLTPVANWSSFMGDQPVLHLALLAGGYLAGLFFSTLWTWYFANIVANKRARFSYTFGLHVLVQLLLMPIVLVSGTMAHYGIDIPLIWYLGAIVFFILELIVLRYGLLGNWKATILCNILPVILAFSYFAFANFTIPGVYETSISWFAQMSPVDMMNITFFGLVGLALMIGHIIMRTYRGISLVLAVLAQISVLIISSSLDYFRMQSAIVNLAPVARDEIMRSASAETMTLVLYSGVWIAAVIVMYVVSTMTAPPKFNEVEF